MKELWKKSLAFLAFAAAMSIILSNNYIVHATGEDESATGETIVSEKQGNETPTEGETTGSDPVEGNEQGNPSQPSEEVLPSGTEPVNGQETTVNPENPDPNENPDGEAPEENQEPGSGP